MLDKSPTQRRNWLSRQWLLQVQFVMAQRPKLSRAAKFFCFCLVIFFNLVFVNRYGYYETDVASEENASTAAHTTLLRSLTPLETGRLVSRNEVKLTSDAPAKTNKTSSSSETPVRSSKRIIIVTYVRSGSSFLGELIQSSPEVFYSFEPLHYLGLSYTNTSEDVERSINLMKSLFQCEFPTPYIEHMWERQTYFIRHNTHALDKCNPNRTLCQDPVTFSTVCKQFRVHLMKVARLPLRAVRQLIDESPDVKHKIIHLVRDPRGIMASRSTRYWCVDQSCTSPSFLCNQMAEDRKVFDEINKLYPNTFYRVQFEHMAAKATEETEKLFEFLGMNVTSPVRKFIASHTNTSDEKQANDPHSTMRDSKTVASSWRKKLNLTLISGIEKACSNILQALDYEKPGLNK